MADETSKQKVYDVRKDGYFDAVDDLVDVCDGPDDSIRVVMVSRQFDGRRMKGRHNLIWTELRKHLSPGAWGKVSLSIGASPEEIKAT